MTFAAYLERQAKTCQRLSHAVTDQRLAERMQEMAQHLRKQAEEAAAFEAAPKLPTLT